MRAKIGFLLGMIIVTAAMAQPPYVIWDRTYGGMGNNYGHDIERISSGGYIVVGYTEYGQPVDEDVYLLNIDDWGNVLWTRIIGGTRGEVGLSVKETVDNGFIISGSTYDGSYLLKTDCDGNVIWERNHIGIYAHDVIQTNDGGYAFTGGHGYSFGDILLVKTDSSGYAEWSQNYGLGMGYALRQTPDGGFIIAGRSGDAYEGNVYVVRSDNIGDTLWTRVFGGEYLDVATDVKLMLDGGYVLAGTVQSFGEPGCPMSKVLLIRMDAYGDTLWLRTYPDFSAIGPDYGGNEVVPTINGGFLIAGYYSFWYDQGYSTGLVLKTDSLGNQEWQEQISVGGWLCFGEFNSVAQMSDGDYVFAGGSYVWEDSTGNNVWLVRLNEYTGIREINTPQPYTFNLDPAYPNPFNASTTISYEIPVGGKVQIRVYDVLGRNVAVLHDG